MPVVDNILVQFYQDAVKNNFLSEKEGRPVYENQDFILKKPLGDNKTEIHRKATQEDKDTYPEIWRAYTEDREIEETGTPLKSWPVMDPARIMECEYHKIRTVDQLAEISDSVCQNMGRGYMELRAQAQGFLRQAADTAAPQALSVEVQALRDEIADRETTIKQMADQIAKLEARLLPTNGATPKQAVLEVGQEPAPTEPPATVKSVQT